MTDSKDEPLNQESIHTLQILDEVASGTPITQRDLSRKLGIALGMTNNYLKRLVKAGYIETTPGHRKRLHYLLTPKGIAEKSALTYRYIKRSYHFFTETRERIGTALIGLKEQGIQSVVLYKATVLAEITVLALLDTDLKLVAIVDDEQAGARFLGQTVEPENALSRLSFDAVLNTTGEPVEGVVSRINRYGIDSKKVYSL
jgi:DNA-binding MarR family transcriptional regulator